MATLDLLLVHLGQGRMDWVQDLAEEMTPILRSQELHRYALGAMVFSLHVPRTQTASAGFVQDIP